MAMIPFGAWHPDMPALSQWAREALNVVPPRRATGRSKKRAVRRIRTARFAPPTVGYTRQL
jgi:hypothetical protein